jgi:hypothetical protein
MTIEIRNPTNDELRATLGAGSVAFAESSTTT